MRILMIGPPGAGKGTQGALIAAHFDIPRIVLGDLLRDQVARRTDLGLAVHRHLSRGELVPDEIMLCIVRQALIAAREAGGGYVFDGVPRTMAQARTAYKIAVELGMTANVAVHLRADDKELIRRLLARAAVEHRSDDTEAVIRHRLELYHQVTQPIIAWYSRRDILVSVDAMRPVGEVGREILAALELKRPPTDRVRARVQRQVNLTGLGAECGQASGLWRVAAEHRRRGLGHQRMLTAPAEMGSFSSSSWRGSPPLRADCNAWLSPGKTWARQLAPSSAGRGRGLPRSSRGSVLRCSTRSPGRCLGRRTR